MYYFFYVKHYNFIFLVFDIDIHKYIKKLVSIIVVNIEARTPNDKVIEKPLIGPEPKTKSINAAIKVVIFASRLVAIALENPFLIAK